MGKHEDLPRRVGLHADLHADADLVSVDPRDLPQQGASPVGTRDRRGTATLTLRAADCSAAALVTVDPTAVSLTTGWSRSLSCDLTTDVTIIN